MNEYEDIRASLLSFLTVFVSEQNALGHTLQALNLDAYANPSEWPATDFVALAEFELDLDGTLAYPTTAFVVSTREDLNLFRMEQLMNRLLNKLLPTKSVMIRNASTGAVRGRLTVRDKVRVGAVQHTTTQPARPLMVSFISDQTFKIA